MNDNFQKKCPICHETFDSKDLYPLAFIRGNILQAATKNYPHLSKEGYVCFPDLRKITGLHYENVLTQEKGTLSLLEKEVLQSLKKHEILTENINEEFDENLTFGDRLADKVAKFGGSWTFIIIFGFILFSWMGINTFQLIQNVFDPYPFIFLNLILSCLAAMQAPIIMMSQNRQSSKDRMIQESDYQINLKAELQTRQLNTRLELFMKHYWQNSNEIALKQNEIQQRLDNLNYTQSR